MKYLNCKVAVVGEGKMLPSVVCCLLQAGHQVKCFSPRNPTEEVNRLSEISGLSLSGTFDWEENFAKPTSLKGFQIVVAGTSEKAGEKENYLKKIDHAADQDALIAINSESIPLEHLQNQVRAPSRLLGVNWTYPAHETLFLEVIANQQTDSEMLAALMTLARKKWGKDPYLLMGGKGIRSRLIAAMAREAFYLVENGYVEVTDIDRACRNDPGYYLPFAGNCRYMDLMGTFIYGVVMKDLNPELSNAREVPGFFDKMIKGERGPDKGYHSHSPSGKEKLEHSFLEFSKEMRALMERYPFPKEGDEE
ncbi:3-hydroxyacyl-CoA dehydrogenase NAD-binding domain-containing protein [Cyclobacterium roseum]|uniref:3-hydroxyacyl-CoA dehydrogenase NAD-binding domain-containing protein n=1 Tax=Cyclobacterium roseum TaxID=2666137 RepID=UPI0013910EC8|nr:3-hydroxyacyl-CoA dehydrogenase NAD-binding domain-containing protein [Cyclobacterium roseum]